MTFFTALLLTKWRGTERNFPLDRGEAMTAVGMKTRSRGQGRAAGVGFESGPWLSMVDEGGFWGRLSVGPQLGEHRKLMLQYLGASPAQMRAGLVN